MRRRHEQSGVRMVADGFFAYRAAALPLRVLAELADGAGAPPAPVRVLDAFRSPGCSP